MDHNKVFPHPLDKWRSPRDPNAMPPRRLRYTSMVDEKAGDPPIDLNTDERLVYLYDVDDGVSEGPWVSSGRVEGWYDTSHNSYDLDNWDMFYAVWDGDSWHYEQSQKPYYYDASSQMNDLPAIYFPGDSFWGPTSILYRESADVIYQNDNSGSGGNDVHGWLWMCVLHIADGVASSEGTNSRAPICNFPFVEPQANMGDLRCRVVVGNIYNAGTSGSPWYPRTADYWYEEASPYNIYFRDGVRYVLTYYCSEDGEILIRSNGLNIFAGHRKTRNTSTGTKEHNGPGHWGDRFEIGAGQFAMVNYQHWDWYLGIMFLGIGDFSFQEMENLEYRLMDKYGITLASGL